MKKLLLIAALLPSLANAGFCDAVYDFAEATMSLRQHGASKYVAKQASDGIKNQDEVLYEILNANVDWAYSVPVVKMENKASVINEFANQSYESCKEAGL